MSLTLTCDPAPPRTRELSGDGGGHWYHPDGRPQHTVLSGKGEQRNTTKADARKMGLLPSVTSITKVVGNEGLDRWKQMQVLNACIAAPYSQGESVEIYTSRMLQESRRKMVDARAFGSLTHNAIDELNKTGFLSDVYAEIKPWIKHYIDWVRDNRIQFLGTEFTAVNPRLGYAGQCDALAMVNGKLTLLDYKTQDVKADKRSGELKPSWYDSWAWQLAAYKHADWQGKPARINQCMSVVICAHTPCYPWTRVWTPKELRDAWAVFKAANTIWQVTNSFNPADNAKEKASANGEDQ